MRRALAVLLLSVLPAALVEAQEQAREKWDGRAFIPPDLRGEVWVDFAAMRESGFWDGVERSLVGLVLQPAELRLGFRLAAVDRLRGYPDLDPPRPGESGAGIFVFEGDETVVTPEGRDGTRSAKLDRFDIVVEDREWERADPSIWVAPRPGLLVHGARRRIEPLLLRRRPPGVVPPELLSLSAGRGVLAHVVMALDGTEAQPGLMRLLGAAADAIAAPSYLMVRVRQESAAGSEPDVWVDGALRWQQDGDGPERMARHLRAKVAELQKHRRLGALKALWRKIEFRVEGRDLRTRLLLGKPRGAGGVLAMLAPVLMFAAVGEAQEVEATATTPAPTAPPPAKDPPPPGANPRGGG